MKNKKVTYSDIDYWASLINESIEEEKQYNEACHKFMENKDSDEEIDEAGELFKVDDNYIKQATAALAELKTTSPADYEQAIKYLNLHKNQNLVVSPEDFAKRRIERASQQTDAPVDTRSTAQQRADLMKAVGDKNKADAEAAAAAAKNKEQKIKSIWIKSLENNIVKLQITFVDGRVEDVEDNVTITDGDKYYKQVAQSLRASRRIAKDPRPVTVKDVQLSMIRLAYNDQRIVWFYGKDKMPESAWKYANEVKKQSRSRSTPLSRAYVTWQSEYGSKAKIYSTR